MDFTNTTARTFTSPSCNLDILTKNQTGIPNLQSLERVKPTGFDLQIENSPENTRSTISGNMDQLKRLQGSVNDYVRQLVADFPLSQGEERNDDTRPLIGDPNCVIGDGNTNNASGLSLDRVENLLDKTKSETPIDRDAPLVAKLVTSKTDSNSIHLKQSELPLAHDLHLGDLRTDKGDRVVTLSALQLFDLSTVLDDCTAELAAAKTAPAPAPSEDRENNESAIPPLTRVSMGSHSEGADTESTLATQLPNLPKLPASEERYTRDMTSTRYNAPKPAFLSAIPWAAAAAVAVGAPVLLLGPNSNSLQELKTKLPQIQMPKVGNKQASPNPTTTTTATATTGATATTTPSAYEPKPVPIPDASATGASPTPAVSPAAQQDGISVGALPPGMGEESSIESNVRSGTPTSSTATSSTKPPATTQVPVTTAVPGGDITTNVGATVPPVTGNSGITPTVTAATTGKPKSPIATKPAKPTKPAPTKTAKAPSVVPNLPSATSTSSIPGLATEMPSVTNLPGMSVPNVSVPGMTATATVDATGKPTNVLTKPAAKKAPAKATAKKAPVAKKPAPKPTTTAKKPPVKPAPAMSTIDTPTGRQPINVPDVVPVDPNPNINVGADGFPINGVPGGIDPAPNPQVATGSDPFDNPAVRDAKRFLKGKWKANANRPGALQYVVKVGAKTGVVKSVSPQGSDSQAYLKQSGIIKPGQKMISPAAAGGSDRTLRAILNPDGSVEVISE